MKGNVEIIRKEVIEVEFGGKGVVLECVMRITADYDTAENFNQINITTN